MSDLETKLAEARERLARTPVFGEVPHVKVQHMPHSSWCGVCKDAYGNPIRWSRCVQKIERERLTLAFDACAAIAREVVAEKDAEIARLEAVVNSPRVQDAIRRGRSPMIRSEASNEEAVKTALLGIVKCMDYTATRAVFDATERWMHDRHAWKNYFAEALLVEAQRRVDSALSPVVQDA
jgi:hypothetical protein